MMKCAARRVLAQVFVVLTLHLADAAGVSAGANENPAAPIAIAAGHPSRHHLQAERSNVRYGRTERSTLDTDGTARLERECAADLCHGSWFDGERSFAFGINGTPFRDRAHEERAQRTFAAIASTTFAEPDFLAAGGRVGRPATTAGSIRFRVTAAGADELVAVADARSQRLTAVERPDGSVYATLVGSVTPTGLIYATRPYEHVMLVNEPLIAPTGPRVRVEATREVSLLAGPLPIVPCRLLGQSARCLIDTGTTPSAMTLAFAERIGREPRGTIEIAGLGSYLTGVVDAGPLECGPATFAALHFAVVPQTHAADFDIILGSDALDYLRLEIDPGRRRAWIGPDAAAADGARTSADATQPAIEIDFRAGLPFTQVRLAGRRDAEAMLVDTGDMATVSIGYDEYRRDPALFAARGQSVAAGIGATRMDAIDGELTSIDVGPAHLERVPISAVRGQHQGHLGFGFAVRCGRFVLELGHERIRCQERPDEVNAANP